MVEATRNCKNQNFVSPSTCEVVKEEIKKNTTT